MLTILVPFCRIFSSLSLSYQCLPCSVEPWTSYNIRLNECWVRLNNSFHLLLVLLLIQIELLLAICCQVTQLVNVQHILSHWSPVPLPQSCSTDSLSPTCTFPGALICLCSCWVSWRSLICSHLLSVLSGCPALKHLFQVTGPGPYQDPCCILVVTGLQEGYNPLL